MTIYNHAGQPSWACLHHMCIRLQIELGAKRYDRPTYSWVYMYVKISVNAKWIKNCHSCTTVKEEGLSTLVCIETIIFKRPQSQKEFSVSIASLARALAVRMTTK